VPEDENGNKYFYAYEGPQGLGDRYYYKIHSWKELGGEQQIEDEPTEDQLKKADFLVIEIMKEGEPFIPVIFENVQWETIPGPWESYEQIEGILGEDFGEEGSRSPATGFTL
jgi:hypothetical protein